jgi:hypothetical protein
MASWNPTVCCQEVTSDGSPEVPSWIHDYHDTASPSQPAVAVAKTTLFSLPWTWVNAGALKSETLWISLASPACWADVGSRDLVVSSSNSHRGPQLRQVKYECEYTKYHMANETLAGTATIINMIIPNTYKITQTWCPPAVGRSWGYKCGQSCQWHRSMY